MSTENPANNPEKKYFVVRLTPPRPTFPRDMTEAEKEIMKQHATYWREMQRKGFVPVFGPVFDPKGVYGLGILAVDTEDQASVLIAADPAVSSGLQQTEISPMRAIVSQQLS